MIPVISIVGTSNSGKTTLLLKIITELKKRNYKVATIKHHHGEIEVDQEGKDTWLHAKAGADQVVLVSPRKAAIFYQYEQEMSLDEVIAKISGVDIIITEGYKSENKLKIEVLRSAVRKELISKPSELIAIASDIEIESDIPIFDLNDYKGLANLIVEKFLLT